MSLIVLFAATDNRIYDKVLLPLINFLSAAIGVLLIINVIVAGIQYIMSDGDPNGIASAKDRLVATFWAFMVFIFGFALLQYLIPGGLLGS
jgi:uncharacterized membrane protein